MEFGVLNLMETYMTIEPDRYILRFFPSFFTNVHKVSRGAIFRKTFGKIWSISQMLLKFSS